MGVDSQGAGRPGKGLGSAGLVGKGSVIRMDSDEFCGMEPKIL